MLETFGNGRRGRADDNSSPEPVWPPVPAAAADAPKLADTDPKDKLLPALKASYDFCTQALAKVDDSNLGEQLTLFGDRKMSRAAAMIAFTSSFADHYGMAAMYLRMNKLVPPTAAQQH